MCDPIHRPLLHPTRPRPMAWALLVLLGGCGGSGSDSASEEGGTVSVASSKLRRDGRAEVVQLRRWLDEGRTDLAAPMLDAIQPELGLEGPLLRLPLLLLVAAFFDKRCMYDRYSFFLVQSSCSKFTLRSIGCALSKF